jgi:cobalt-zinc-cadmium efflux system membrane fusion protein
MNLKNTLSALLVAFALFGFAGCGKSGGQHTEGDGHDHAAESTGHDEHGGEGHDEHGEEVVRLTDAQLEEAGVVIEPLSSGVITTHVTLPAEVGLNQDAVLHVTPRVPGIVTEVFVYLGDDIAAGTPLTVIESPQLGEAKIAYLQAIQARAIAEGELERQRTISENTASLLDLLRDEPEVDVLRTTASDLRIGENKGRLISAYAKLNAARANYTRERDLRLKNLSTEADLLAAQETYNSSQADYFGAFEDIDFTYRLRLQEAEQAASVTASTVDNAERRLHLLGLSDEQVAKHVTPGEKVNDEEPIYTIANLDSVWLNISVYSEYAGLISEGQSVVIHADKRTASGVVDYVSAVVSEGTRTVSARVVVDNTDGSWKPGEFVTARVETGETRAARVVPLEAIQTFEGQSVVFVQDEDGIEPKPVTLGRRNDLMVELLGDDIALGTPIVVTNSFLMKAELGKSAAGHDH